MDNDTDCGVGTGLMFGIGGVVIALMVLILGAMLSRLSTVGDCEKLGAFRHGASVYTCTRKEK